MSRRLLPTVAAGRRIGARSLRAGCPGTFLTGVTSSVLMGVALFAALDGREQLADPAGDRRTGSARRDGDRRPAGQDDTAGAARQIAKAKDRRRMEVSMVTKVGDRDVIRTMPFVQIKMALAANHQTTRNYPAFDPLQVFAEDGAAQPRQRRLRPARSMASRSRAR